MFVRDCDKKASRAPTNDVPRNFRNSSRIIIGKDQSNTYTQSIAESSTTPKTRRCSRKYACGAGHHVKVETNRASLIFVPSAVTANDLQGRGCTGWRNER